MKKQMTKPYIYTLYDNVFVVPYAEIQTLSQQFETIGYNAGIYGWNFDVVRVDWDTVILTGYRPPNGRKIPRDIYTKYEKAARAEREKWTGCRDYEKRVEKIVESFVNELKNL